MLYCAHMHPGIVLQRGASRLGTRTTAVSLPVFADCIASVKARLDWTESGFWPIPISMLAGPCASRDNCLCCIPLCQQRESICAATPTALSRTSSGQVAVNTLSLVECRPPAFYKNVIYPTTAHPDRQDPAGRVGGANLCAGVWPVR
jgi:hypothetical protein